MNRIRLFVYFVLIIALGFAFWRVWKFRSAVRNPDAIPSSGGRNLAILPADPGVFYLQNNPVWRRETIGGSGESIGSVGCTLCAVAMAATDLGHEIDPAELNERLKRNAGYTERGWIIWSAVKPSLSDHAEAVFTTEVSHDLVEQLLERGDVPIVKIFLPGGIPHWVTVVGKDGYEYLVKDPAYKPKKLIKLSKRGPRIHAIRFLKKTN